MTHRTIMLAVSSTLLGLSALAVSSAEAGFRRPVEGDVAVARSRFGNGTVSGPVRQTRTGYEVQLPGGTWIGCRRSCSETLRVQTVDFFENNGRMSGFGDMTNECGIFGCLSWGF